MIKNIYKNGKTLRYGYTTGSCAAAAAKAATHMLLSGKQITSVELMTPKGWLLNLEVLEIEAKESVACAIKKDSGDDPDITNGILIHAKVSKTTSDLKLIGGIGVGQVTKKGLSVAVGEPAINPVPRKMIIESVQELCRQYGYEEGLEIEISVPEGVEIAKKTFNPKLGILGGISIIGTTGIVEPMSEEAFKDSLRLELNQISDDMMVLTPGNYGRDYCMEFGVSENKILKISNFVGYMFERAVEAKKKKILFIGHIGKLIKVAGGIFHTHSRVSDARMDILVSHLVRIHATHDQLSYVLTCNTTEEAVNYIVDEGLSEVFDLIVESIQSRLEGFVFEGLKVEVILFSLDQGLLSKTKCANDYLEVLSE